MCIDLELDNISLYLFVCVFCLEPKEYVAQDISVRVMSPQSVLVSWVDPVVEMGKVDPGVPRWESMHTHSSMCVLQCDRDIGEKRMLALTLIKYCHFLLTQILHS